MIFFLVAGWPMPESNSLVLAVMAWFLVSVYANFGRTTPHIIGQSRAAPEGVAKPDLYGRVLLLCVQSGAHSRPAPGGRSRLAATSPAAPGGAAWRLARLMAADGARPCLDRKSTRLN